MPPVQSVAVLLHEHHHGAESTNYKIWAMAQSWREMGIRVEVLRGLGREPEADVLFPHIDLSYIPDDYWAFIQRHPNVVNRHVRDIRKTIYSTLRVTPGDGYAGPVIVKTVLNHLGRNERAFGVDRPGWRERRMDRLRRWQRFERRTLGSARTLHGYHVFDAPGLVPRAVYANPHLLVERFIPERCGDKYVSRRFTVFGDQSSAHALHHPGPFTRAGSSTMVPDGPVPEEILEWRRKLRLDYAKLDYVMHEGRASLIDINITSTILLPINAQSVALYRGFAQGIHAFAPPEGPPASPAALTDPA